MSEKKVIQVLNGQAIDPPPVWLMRQAGRYLPEYRELRAEAGSFWTMCMTPKMAAEITLQPIRRFGFDAAILFSDILVIPAALGLPVSFDEGVGPRMRSIASDEGLSFDAASLTPVYEALDLVRSSLPPGTALLGFAGAPWTLATYMAAGRGGDDQKAAKLWGYRDPDGFARLLELLADCVAQHLVRQIDAGADAVQIFDSWASGLPEEMFKRWVVQPTRAVVAKLRAFHPKAKVIGFPRAATLAGYARYAHHTGVDAVSLDTSAPLSWATERFSEQVVVQGNLDPIALIAGGAAQRDAVDAILRAMEGKRFIFNLGHGILPETPIEHVEALIAQVRGGR